MRTVVAFVEATTVIGQLLMDPKKGMGSVKKIAHWLRGHGAGHRRVGLGNTTGRREILFRTSHSVFLFCYSLLAELAVNQAFARYRVRMTYLSNGLFVLDKE